jgi:hypothetical protein
MKNPRSKPNATKSSPPPDLPGTPARQSKDNERLVMLPADPVAERQAVRDAFVNLVGAHVFSAQMHGLVSENDAKVALKTAEIFIAAIRESVQPRDAIEEMLVVQMAWTHARLARLSAIAQDQQQRRNVQVVHDACDRAANTFRRQMLTLADYRRPAQPSNFVAIAQANLANQQVVQNVEGANRQNENTSNEQRSAPTALPPVTQGSDFPSCDGGAKQAVAAEHRPQDGGGEGPIQAQRHEARRAYRQQPGDMAGAERGAAGGKPG